LQSSILRFAQRFFLGVGILLLAYAGGTAAYAGIYQHYQLLKFERQIAAPKEETLDLSEGSRIGKLEIPRVGISVMVFHGAAAETLVLGAGHVPGTPLPGGDGNIVIAAHRDTYFRKVEGVIPGDRIQFTTARGSYTYIVHSTEIVDPEDTRVMESRDLAELTLITCYPFYFVGSAPKRFIVHARPE
jgi:sortase A